MSCTTLPDGSVRYAPDLRHRARWTKARRRNAAAALAVAVPLGLASIGRIGWQVGLPVAGVTAVVTLLGVLVWRLTLPSQHTVTFSASLVTLRSYGRSRSVAVDDRLRGSAVLLVMQHGISVPYLVVDGTGRPFRLNPDMWSDEDLDAMAARLPVRRTEPLVLTPREAEREFPGLLPFAIRRPNWFAVLAVVVMVVLVLLAGIGYVAVTEEQDEQAPAAAPAATSTAAPDLSREASGRQNRLQADVQRLLGDDGDWTARDPFVRDCPDGSYRRIVSWFDDDPRARYTEADRRAVGEVARAAGLTERDGGLRDGRLSGLRYEDPETLAALDVDEEDGVLSVTTESACSGAG